MINYLLQINQQRSISFQLYEDQPLLDHVRKMFEHEARHINQQRSDLKRDDAVTLYSVEWVAVEENGKWRNKQVLTPINTYVISELL